MDRLEHMIITIKLWQLQHDIVNGLGVFELARAQLALMHVALKFFALRLAQLTVQIRVELQLYEVAL